MGALVGCGPDQVATIGDDVDGAGEVDGGGDDDDDGAADEPADEPDEAPSDTQLVPRGTRVAVTTVTGALDDGVWPGAVEIAEHVDGTLHRQVLVETGFPDDPDIIPDIRVPMVRAGAGWIAVGHRSGYRTNDPYALQTFDVANELPFAAQLRHRVTHEALGPGIDGLTVVEDYAFVETGEHLFEVALASNSTTELTQHVGKLHVLPAGGLVYIDEWGDDSLHLRAGGETTTLLETEGRITTVRVMPDDNTVLSTVSLGDHGEVVAAYADQRREPWVALETGYEYPLVIHMASDASAATAYDFLEPGVPRPYHFDLESGPDGEAPRLLSETLVWGDYSRYGDWLAFGEYQIPGMQVMERSTGALAKVELPYEPGTLETCGGGVSVAPDAEAGTGLVWISFADEATHDLTGQRVQAVACSPSHRWLAWHANDDSVWFAAVQADGIGDPIEVEAGGDPLRSLAWSPDGSHLLLERCRAGTGADLQPCDGTLAAWDLQAESRTLLYEGTFVDYRSLGL